jgi:hypothetical protein
MEQWHVVVLFILLFIVLVFPTKDVISMTKNDSDILKCRTLVNVFLWFVYLLIYLLFFSKHKDNIFIMSCFFVSIYMHIIIEIFVFQKINENKLKSRIKSIPNFMDLTEGQIRNELIKLYDEVYEIKIIKKILKKFGYYN